MQHSRTFVERLFDGAVHYRKEVALSAALMAVSAASIAGYFVYKNHIARQGHKAYASALQLMQARVLKNGEVPGQFETVFVSSGEKWAAVAEAFGRVYGDFGQVGIGVMAGAAQAQALMRLGELEKARTLLGEVVARISSPELRSLYSLTYARLLIDSANAAEMQQGVALLAQLAATKDSSVHDSALYYLGLHYWLTGDFVSASNYWQQLVVQYEGFDKKASPWLTAAKEKLAMIQSAPDAA